MRHNSADNNCPINADPRNETCGCNAPMTVLPQGTITIQVVETELTDNFSKVWDVHFTDTNTGACMVFPALSMRRAYLLAEELEATLRRHTNIKPEVLS